MGISSSDVYVSPLKSKLDDLFADLDKCGNVVQKLIIKEINKALEQMNKEDLKYTMTQKLFDNLHSLIDKKKLSLENALAMLKSIGYHKELRKIYGENNSSQALSNRFRKMIENEERKEKKGGNENLLTDLCECYLLLFDGSCEEEISRTVAICLLKVASNKDTSEEAQNKVEIALLAMGKGNISIVLQDKYDYFLNEISEIIRYHQDHRNLSHLSYQSAWFFILYRLKRNKQSENLWKFFVTKKDFYREATKELNELSKCVNRIKKEKKEMRKEIKNFYIIERWLHVFTEVVDVQILLVEIQIDIMKCVANISRRTKDSFIGIREKCTDIIMKVLDGGVMNTFDLIGGGAVDAMLEELSRSYMIRSSFCDCSTFFENIHQRLTGTMHNGAERMILKRMMIDKLEENGFEDVYISIPPVQKKNIIYEYFVSGLIENEVFLIYE
ncbi:uncharacterized protein MONOS_18622 [Monocercomonoides exilis]|uniref:uncharacterized protein n=1 Tax=Monocercomonoides exilis TaxID=2049356 RepID=UPI00355A2BC0|nr:hypothetical protein MONOS_18622 [Monocercomonoides exilis]